MDAKGEDGNQGASSSASGFPADADTRFQPKKRPQPPVVENLM
jgi:hypothetical protein